MTAYTINEEVARSAHQANHMSDYTPGSATAGYESMLTKAQAIADEQKAKVDPIHHDKIDALLDTYARKLAANVNKGNEIAARVPSILISGRANFPTAKKAKQVVAMDRNMEEFNEIQGILQKIKSVGMGGISADDPNALEKLEAKLESRIDLQERMKRTNRYYKMHGHVIGCYALTETQQVELDRALKERAADPYVSHVVPFEPYQLSNNNAEINRLRKRIAALKEHKASDMSGWEFDGGEVVPNKEANRLQVFFDDKPDDDVRAELKSNGFRWAPSHGAWQRQLTENAMRAARRVKSIQPQT